MDSIIAQVEMDSGSASDDIVEMIQPIRAVNIQDDLIVVKKRGKKDGKPKPKRYAKSPVQHLEILEDKSKVQPAKRQTEFIDNAPEPYDIPVCPSPAVAESPQQNVRHDAYGDDGAFSDCEQPPYVSSHDDAPREKTYEQSPSVEVASSTEHAEPQVAYSDTPKFRFSNPPTIKQMGIKYNQPVPDLDNVEPEVVSEENQRRDWLHKCEMLRKKYGYDNTLDLAGFTMNSDTEMIKDVYARRVKAIMVEQSSKSYDQYLYISFVIIELASNKVLGVDMTGFAQAQKANQEAYRDLLFELGEEWYKPPSSVTGVKNEYPALVRLSALVLFNAAAFWAMKYAAESMMGAKRDPNADDTADAMNAFLTGFLPQK